MRIFKCTHCHVIKAVTHDSGIELSGETCGIVRERYHNEPGAPNPREDCQGELAEVKIISFI